MSIQRLSLMCLLARSFSCGCGCGFSNFYTYFRRKPNRRWTICDCRDPIDTLFLQTKQPSCGSFLFLPAWRFWALPAKPLFRNQRFKGSSPVNWVSSQRRLPPKLRLLAPPFLDGSSGLREELELPDPPFQECIPNSCTFGL